MIDRLRPLADRICESRGRVAENAEEIRKSGTIPAGTEDASIIIPVDKKDPGFSVCAVDGGLLADRFVGSDIVVRRSVAVNFSYSGLKLGDVRHHPKKFPDTEVGFMSGLDEHEALVFRSLFRLGGEISVAIEAVERFQPDFLLLDGSIVPLGTDRPGEGSLLSKDYEMLLKAYKTLYQKCESSGCQLVGVIKDSRGKRLVDALHGMLVVDVPDLVLADALLHEGERTCALRYSDDSGGHPVLKGLGEWADKARMFYVKPSTSDSPLRIEYLAQKKNADEIASSILVLCSISKAFAYPAALIEADMCAALDPLEMEKIKRSLFVLTGGASRPLRRAERPFR